MVKKETRKTRRQKERKLLTENTLEDDYKEDVQLENDFFIENGDEVDYKNLDFSEEASEEYNDDEFDEGSNLDYDDDDYEGSEVEIEEKTVKKLDKKTWKEIKKKALSGSGYHISQCIGYFSKIISEKDEIEDENEEESEDKDKDKTKDKENLLTSKEGSLKIIKFNLKELPELLHLKISKGITKKFLSLLVKFLKQAENWDLTLIASTFSALTSHSNILKSFRKYKDVLIKTAVKYWIESEEFLSGVAFEFIREFVYGSDCDYALKSCYLAYLNISKGMNKGNYKRISRLRGNLIDMILSIEEEVAYKNVFLFLRKICLELNKTISDKKWESIKTIYNWQVINSLILWSDFLIKNEKSTQKMKSFDLLLFPFIQISVGVLRLHVVNNFIPLRMIIIKQLLLLSQATKVNIPLIGYMIEVLESNIFSKYYKSTDTKNSKLSLEGLKGKERKRMKKKIIEKMKKIQEKKEKSSALHSLSGKENQFKREFLYVTLKIKDFESISTVVELSKLIIETIIENCCLLCNRLNFPEVALPIVFNLKRIMKSLKNSQIKEVIKEGIVTITSSIEYMNEFRLKIEEIELKKTRLIERVEEKIKEKVKDIPLYQAMNRIRKSEILNDEMRTAIENDEFIDI